LTGHIDRIIRLVKQLSEYDSSWTAHLDGLRESLYRIEDLTLVARDYTGSIDFSPERLDQVEKRLSELDRLSAKYGKSMAEVLAFADQCEGRLQELMSSNDTSIQLSAELEAGLRSYLELAGNLSSKRHKDAARLEREIRKEFQALAMESMDLNVHFRPQDRACAGAQERLPGYCGPDGIDQIEFLLAPNPGEEMRPLSKIASGGELSRIMLSIKELCGGEEAGKTLVFDEIDAGIGGRVAEVVGKRLREVALRNQVLCVTHLPQIAAYARSHFSVRKETVGTRTETFIAALNQEARIAELARMLGGEIITETTRRHAREILDHASKAAKKEGAR
jgi:DNA repair protein RecN (Recombination protein N)